MKRLQKPELLGMAGRGSRGEQVRADGSTLEEGVHLRWQMAPELGFPSDGFDVFRRDENYWKYLRCGSFMEGDLDRINWIPYGDDITSKDVTIESSGDNEVITGCPPNEVLSASFPGEQEVRLDFAEPVRFISLQFDTSTPPNPVADAYWKSPEGDVLLATKSAYLLGSRRYISLFGNHTDYVILRGEDMVICRLCIVFVSDGYKDGWSKDPLNGKTPIYLPITHPDWNSPHANAPNDLAEAKARLPAGQPPEMQSAYTKGFRQDLHDILYDLVGTDAQHMFRIKETDENSDATLDWPGMSLLQLQALDPNIARILGLYWHDEPPSVFKFYDYRVVAHYGDAPFPGFRIDFSDQIPGTRHGSLLQHEGVTYVSANPIDIVRATWDNSEHNALLFTRTIPAGPISITVPKNTQSITLRLTAAALFVVKVMRWDTALLSETKQAGEHTLSYEDANSFDAILFFPIGEITLFEIVLRKQIGEIGNLAYDVYHLRSRTQSVVPVPTLEPPKVASTTTGLAEDGKLMQNQSGVALRWDRHEAGGVYLQAGAPMLFHVQREDLDPDSDTVLRSGVLNEDRPTLVSKRGGEEGEPDTEGPHYADRSVPDGRYNYSVRGIDLFGVLGEWSASQQVEVHDRLAPPPPQSVQAQYLDPADPYLSEEDRTWAEANGTGLKLSWHWPGLFRMQAPDAVEPLAEFRIYSQKGGMNGLVGNIIEVTPKGPTSDLTMDIQWQAGTDDLAGEWIRLNENFFKIVGSGRGPNTVITVENLTAPDLLPETGPFSITFSPDRYYSLDYGKAKFWRERLHAEPVQDAPVISTSVVSIADYDKDAVEADEDTIVSRAGATRTVTLSAGLADSDDVLLPGVLFCEGTVYPVYGHTTGSALALHLVPPSSSTEIGATVEPPIGASCAYFPSRRYEIRIPGYSLPIAPGQATSVGQIAMSCSDGKAHTDDDPVWSRPNRGGLGGRSGNESTLSPIVKVTATLRTPPAAVANVPAATDDPIFAQPADYYGQARYTLSWGAVPNVAGYAVYRCSGAALFDQDRRLRQQQKGTYQSGSVFADDADFADWLAEYDASLTENDMVSDVDGHIDAWRAWAQRFYVKLTDAQVQNLANLEGNEEAFRRINKEAIEEARLDDRFDGRGRGFYVYRVRTIDAAGNESAWKDSRVFPAVHIYDVTPPETPSIDSITSGENSITLSWTPGRQPDIVAYHIWRSESEDQLADVRRLETTAVLLHAANTVMQFTDENLVGLRAYHYRIAAVDANGNVSKPTNAVTARVTDTTPPSAPVWGVVEWISDANGQAVRLTWQTDEASVSCTAQRRPLGGGIWFAVSGELEATLPPYDFEFLDRTAEPGLAYEYRVVAYDLAGNKSSTYNVVQIWPEEQLYA